MSTANKDSQETTENSVKNSSLSTNCSDMFISDYFRGNSSYSFLPEQKFSTESTLSYCKDCGVYSYTNTKKRINKCNMLILISTLSIGWLIYQKARKKELTCNDVDHFCSECNALIFEFKS